MRDRMTAVPLEYSHSSPGGCAKGGERAKPAMSGCRYNMLVTSDTAP
jgi:hypothetical protein